MTKLLQSLLLLLILSASAQAQMTSMSSHKATKLTREMQEKAGIVIDRKPSESKVLPLEVSVNGATQMSLKNWYSFQTSGRAIHNIQVDPSNPQRVHAVAMAEPNPGPQDTSATVVWPGRRVYYMFSSNGGSTWSEPVSITSTRSGYPDLILYKKGNDYLPIVGLHRRVTGDEDIYASAIYIGKGTPGSGEFTEVAADRTYSEGGDFDIIWPSITLSPDQTKIYMISSIIRENTTDDYRRMQFSSFDLNAGDGSATWNGPWKVGPGDDVTGQKTGGGFVIRTAPSGKIGVIWMGEPDADQSMYYSESTDGGATWTPTTFPIYERAGVASSDASLLTPADGLDMFFDGETAVASWTAYAVVDDGSNNYYPSLGALMYWRNGFAVPMVLVAREGFSSDLDDPWFPLADLGFFGEGTTAEPQGANVESSAFALTQHPKKFSIFFETWREGDTSEVYEWQRSEGSEVESNSFVYRSIQYVTTTDGGDSWSDPVIFRGNDVENVNEKKQDYRFPNVSTWNPQVDQNNVQYHAMYSVDETAGIWVAGGTPTWSEISYFFEKKNVEVGGVGSVKQIGTSDNMTLGQNYPNPFNPSTSISFTLKNPTKVTLTVEDMMGRTVATVFDGLASSGTTPVKFDASELSAGVYQYVLASENESVSRRMVLTK